MASKRPELGLLALSHCNQSTTPADSESLVTSSSSSDAGDSTHILTPTDSNSNDSTSIASSTPDDDEISFYKNAQWTRDGTTIITSSWGNDISSFLIPEDLLDPRDSPLTLRPHWTLQLATSTNVVASAPYYDIRWPNTEQLLIASQDHPLQLYQTGPPPTSIQEDDAAVIGNSSRRNVPIGSYHFTSPTTEAYYPIHSLVWSTPGTHFYVGTRDLIAQFDVTRNGDGPSSLIPTIPSRRHIRKGNGVGMRGTVSALSAQTTADDAPTGLIAAGTWTRWVGLYDMARSGECTATWSIGGAAESVVHTDPPADRGLRLPPHEWISNTGNLHAVKGIGGAGIMQTAWSPCGRYLLLNERKSTGMLVYDVRGTNKLLSFLAGRDALTHQRMSCDVFRGLESVGGFEVWAGAKDGTVKVWEGIGDSEGCQWPSWDFSVADGADGARGTVSPGLGSVSLHHSGSVVATCAGSLSCDGSWTEDRGVEGSSLKLWSIGASAPSNETDAVISSEQDAIIESEQRDIAMKDIDEVELHRQRVLSTLNTETKEAESHNQPGTKVEIEAAQDDIAMEEADEVEQHRERMLAILSTPETNGAEPHNQPGARLDIGETSAIQETAGPTFPRPSDISIEGAEVSLETCAASP